MIRFLIVLSVAATAALAGTPEAVVDDLGTSVHLSQPPQRIVSLAPSNTELLFALGLAEQMAGVTTYCNYPDAATQVEQVAGFSDLSAEKIAAVRPDLIVASRGNDPEALETVRQMGIPVFGLANNSVADVIESVRRLGRLTGRQEHAGTVADALQARIDTLQRRLSTVQDRPRVLWGFAGDPIYTAGAGSIIDDVILTAGGTNQGRAAGDGWPQVSLETVVSWRVEVLLMSLRLGDKTAAAAVQAEVARLQGVDGWRQVPAVAHGRIVHVDGDVLTRAGPRIVDAVEQLSLALHPTK